MAGLEIAKAVSEIVVATATNKKVRKMVLGTYDDGRPRSIPDAINGTTKSPRKKKKKKKKSSNFEIM